MKNIPDPDVRMYVVWMPLLKSDSHAAADQRAAEFYEGRMRYFWDGNSAAGLAYQPVLEWPDIVWDVYLLYSKNSKWSDATPPKPDLYMHQRGADFQKAPVLNREQLEAKIKELLQAKSSGK